MFLERKTQYFKSLYHLQLSLLPHPERMLKTVENTKPYIPMFFPIQTYL